MERMDRRKFLASSAVFGGGVLLAGCGGGAGSQPSAGGTPTETHPPIGQEPGTLNILEWPGYEAGGTKAQTYGMLAGTNYTDEFGANGLKYTYIVNDTQAVNKARQAEFDLMHPCIENVQDYVNSGLVQPWDTSLLPSFKNLNPALTERGHGQRQAVLRPVGLGLREHPLPHRHGRRGRRDRLGALLEREVQGPDLDVGRRPVQLRGRRPQARLPGDGQPDLRPGAAVEGSADRAEAAEQVLLEERRIRTCSRPSRRATSGSRTRGRTAT